MKFRNSVFLPIILIVMVAVVVALAGVFVAQAEEATPQFVEEGTSLPTIPSNITESQEISALGYKISTSKDDPLCDTGFNGYIDLAEQNISVTARVPSSNNMAIGPFFTTGGSIGFYGQQYTGLWITDDGFVICNIDVIVHAEDPKLSNYKQKMQFNLAYKLAIDESLINIKATTNEGLGVVGRKEGIAAFASVLLKKK